MSCFSSPDESAHYAASVGLLLQRYRGQLGWEREGVVELGSGDASAVADVVAALPGLRVRSYDISASSVEQARRNIAARGVADRYTVEVGDFFDRADSGGGPPVSTVIANPPYLPAPDRGIRMPGLWGGVDGNDVSLHLLKAGYPTVLMAVPSYSDPAATVATAADLGYRVANSCTVGLDLGPYSNEPRVRARIRQLCAEGRGWVDDGGYLVAVALFTQHPGIPGDRGGQLLRALQVA